MRGNPQAASARLLAVAPTRRWSAWLAQERQRRRQSQIEALVITERLRAEERRARRSGAHTPNVRQWL